MSKSKSKPKAKSKRRRPADGSTQSDHAQPEDAESNPRDNSDATETTPETDKIASQDIQGIKHFAAIMPLLEPLRDHQCGKDSASNRKLHFDEYCRLALLYMFNPTITSLRSLAQASELSKVQQRLECGRASRTSLSEAARTFDADELLGVIQMLGEKMNSIGRDTRLNGIKQTISLIDGSVVSAMPELMQASFLKQTEGSGLVQWRLHTHFEVDRYIPTRIDVTPNGGGENDERAVAERTIEPDHLYMMDRGYAKFALFNSIVKKDSSYICRLRDNSVYKVVQERDLSEAATEANALSDEVVLLGESSKNSDKPDHAIRLIRIRCTPHQNRTGGKPKGSKAPNSDGVLRIATNLLDVPAEVIGLLYEQRWQIEIFFRFYKQFLGCSHLIHHNENGIKMQAYCAIIACLLINLWTGRKPTKRTFEMLSFYFMGLATEEELAAHLEARAQAEENAKTQG